MYDLFISYRREGGYELARLLYSSFKEAGLNPFFDVEELRSGPFDEKLYTYIEESQNFVLVLSPNSLQRCESEKDWVRLEIERAIKLKKNIIPVMMKNFTFPDNLPESLSPLPMFNGATINQEYFNASIEKIISLLVNVKPKKVAKLDEKQQEHIEKLYHQGMDYLENHSYAPAIACFEEIRDINPGYVRSYWGQLLAMYRCSSNNELIENTSEDFNDSQLLASALALAGESDYKIYTEVVEKRTKNCISLAKNALKSKKFEDCIRFSNLALQRRQNDLGVLWTKLLAENSVCSTNELKTVSVSKGVKYIESKTYQEILNFASDEEKARLEGFHKSILAEIAKNTYQNAYDKCNDYLCKNIGEAVSEEKKIKAEMLKKYKEQQNLLIVASVRNEKFLGNNFFIILFSILCFAIPVYLVILGLFTLGLAGKPVLGVGLTGLGIVVIFLLSKLKKFASNNKKTDNKEEKYDKINQDIYDSTKLLKEVEEKRKQLQALYDDFLKHKDITIEEMQKYQEIVKKKLA